MHSWINIRIKLKNANSSQSDTCTNLEKFRSMMNHGGNQLVHNCHVFWNVTQACHFLIFFQINDRKGHKKIGWLDFSILHNFYGKLLNCKYLYLQSLTVTIECGSWIQVCLSWKIYWSSYPIHPNVKTTRQYYSIFSLHISYFTERENLFNNQVHLKRCL